LFPEQWNEAEFIAKYFKPYFFCYFSYAKKSREKCLLIKRFLTLIFIYEMYL
jgi:hypothetical protein